MNHTKLLAVSLTALVALSSPASAQIVDISGAAKQTSINSGIVTNTGVISAARALAGSGSSASIASVGAANDASFGLASQGRDVTALPSVTVFSYDMKQTATNAATGIVSNAGRIVIDSIASGGSANISSIGAANSIGVSINRQ